MHILKNIPGQGKNMEKGEYGDGFESSMKDTMINKVDKHDWSMKARAVKLKSILGKTVGLHYLIFLHTFTNLKINSS